MATGLEMVREIIRGYEKNYEVRDKVSSDKRVYETSRSWLEVWGDLVEQHPIGVAGGRRF